MRCLCCGKIIEDKNDNSWHLECIKKFFDTYKLPLIDLSSSNEELLKFGENYVSKNDSVIKQIVCEIKKTEAYSGFGLIYQAECGA